MEVYTILKCDVRVPLLANSPHSSMFIPSDLRRSLLLNDGELNRELLLLTDRYVDELFSSILEAGGILVKYNLSRLVVDPERFEDDEREEMSKVGMGAIYVKASDGRSLRNKPDQTERERLLDRFYRPYHRSMEEEVQGLLERFGRCLILDCHSFSSVPLPFEPDQDPERPDICIGTDKFHTPIPLMEAVEQFFNRNHLVVTVNKPYAGTYIPSKYLEKKDIRVSSIMIEINRKLYMDEKTGEKLSRFEDVKNAISDSIHSVVVPHVTTKG
jgi:N-formylglutamate amidohydrolase